MKEKTKKIMAGLGIGLALVGGGFTMTGCTETPVTDDQVDKVFTALDNANKFMEDVISNLTNQNQVLVDQNEKLENIIVEMENQNQDQLYEDMVKLYDHSVRRMRLNLDNVWDNMRVVVKVNENGEELGQTTEYYKLENDTNVLLLKQSDADGVYDYCDSNETQEEKLINVGNGSSEIATLKVDFDYYAATWWTGLNNGIMIFFDKEEITSVKVLENGNYLINVYKDNLFDLDNYKCIYNCELTSDGYLVKINMNMWGHNYEKSYYMWNFEYGVLTEAEVQANIDSYNNAQSSTN